MVLLHILLVPDEIVNISEVHVKSFSCSRDHTLGQFQRISKDHDVHSLFEKRQLGDYIGFNSSANSLLTLRLLVSEKSGQEGSE